MPLIRPATTEDALTISRIHAAAWRSTYEDILPKAYLDRLRDDHWTEYFAQRIGKGSYKSYVTIVKSKAVGCVTFGPNRMNIAGARQEENWGEIYSIYVLPEFQGQGQGKALVKHAIRQMKEAGYRGCSLWILEANRSSRWFLHSMKFKNDLKPRSFTIMDQTLINLRYSMEFQTK